ncbi:MAG TPA: deoxyribonuclease IV [bacterium]|nr:deoxyribonuclease IV [bacterium]
MKFGTHISAAGGVQNAPINAHKNNCECYQFFSRSPQGGKAPELTVEIIKKFKANNKKFGFKDFYIHAPYYINLASTKNTTYYGSISVLREELERGSLLGVKYLMTHLGSAKELGRREAVKKVVAGLEKILTGYQGTTEFLIEISAGAGAIIGDTFEEIATIIHNSKFIIQKQIGVCFDTAHAFASGYDLRTLISVKKVLDNFDEIIGLKKLKLIHLNESMTEFGSHKDRHEHLGFGKIGLEGIEALIKDKRLKNINYILETPTDVGTLEDLKILKKMRANLTKNKN